MYKLPQLLQMQWNDIGTFELLLKCFGYGLLHIATTMNGNRKSGSWTMIDGIRIIPYGLKIK